MFIHVPLLPIQRDLLAIPRGMARFRRYIEVVTGGTDDAVYPPLAAFNPMAKPHVSEVVDALLAVDAEAVAFDALHDAARRLPKDGPSYRVGLVVADDVAGGWTDRALIEAHGLRNVPSASESRGWIPLVLWTGDPPTAEVVRRSVLAQVYRFFHLTTLGPPADLASIVEQERRVSAFAGLTGPTLDPDDLDYSRAILDEHADSDDLNVQFAWLYGDALAKAKGYTPLGLSPNAGWAVIRAESPAVDPLEALRIGGLAACGR